MKQSFQRKNKHLMHAMRVHGLTYDQARLGLQFLTLTSWTGSTSADGLELLFVGRCTKRFISHRGDERPVTLREVIEKTPRQTMLDAGEYLASASLVEHYRKEYGSVR